MANLYELTGEYLDLQSVIDMAGGELILEVEEAIEALALNKETAVEKLEGYGKVLSNMTAEAAGLKAEEARLSSRRKVLEGSVERLKCRVFDYMTIADEKKIKAGTFTFTVQRSGAALVIDDGAVVPDDYWIEQDPKLDKASLKDAIKAGLELEGCRLESKLHLRVK